MPKRRKPPQNGGNAWAGEVFAERLAEVRERRGWTQQQLADRMNELGWPYSRWTITKIEQGGQRARKVMLEEAFALAVALNVAPVFLFVPIDDDRLVSLTSKRSAPAWRVRDWVRGNWFATDSDEEVEENWRFFVDERPESERQWVKHVFRDQIARDRRLTEREEK